MCLCEAESSTNEEEDEQLQNTVLEGSSGECILMGYFIHGHIHDARYGRETHCMLVQCLNRPPPYLACRPDTRYTR